MNRAHEYLRQNGQTVADWDGDCGGLADAVISPDDDIIYVVGDIGWRYHMVPLIGGLIHDAWCEGPALPVKDWLVKMFGGAAWVTLALNGEDFFDGEASSYDVDLIAMIRQNDGHQGE